MILHKLKKIKSFSVLQLGCVLLYTDGTVVLTDVLFLSLHGTASQGRAGGGVHQQHLAEGDPLPEKREGASGHEL